LTAPDANSFKTQNKRKTERIVNIGAFANRHFYADILTVSDLGPLNRDPWHTRCFTREIEVGVTIDQIRSNVDKKAVMADFQ
jgi:hypothetical protein